VCVSLQQAWPGGTQQILLPSTWQQLPGVALHNSVQPTAVIPEAMGSGQQLTDWRQVPCVPLWEIYKGRSLREGALEDLVRQEENKGKIYLCEILEEKNPYQARRWSYKKTSNTGKQ